MATPVLYKFTRRGTYLTLHQGTPLPPPGEHSEFINAIQPPRVGYHAYTADVFPHITDKRYDRLADLWICELYGRITSYLLLHDRPAGVIPTHPITCYCGQSMTLIRRVTFTVTKNGIQLT